MNNIDGIVIYEEKDIKYNNLIIKNIKLDVDSYEYKIFDEVDLDNVLKFDVMYEEGKQVLKYNVNNHISLHEYLKYNKLKRKDLIFIIKNIYKLLLSIENYLIDEGSILLSVKSIMLCKEDDTLMKFCIIPSLKSDFSYELSKLLVRLLRHIDTNDKDALNIAYELFLKSSKTNYSIHDLMQVIEDVEKKEYEEAMAKIEYENNIESNEYDIEFNYDRNFDDNIVEDKNESSHEIVNKNIKIDNKFNNLDNDNEYSADIEIDDNTKKDLNMSLFDEIDADIKNNRKKSRKKLKKKIFLNANIKFHGAIIPIIATILPIIIFLLLGMDFLYTHILMLVFYEIIVIFIITLNSFFDTLYSRLQ